MASQPKLLIVDDEEILLEILAEALEPLNLLLFRAVSGEEALEIVRKEKPDAILSDIEMPGMGGIGLLQQIREMGLVTPFIFLTGFGTKENAITALKLGALDFLEKPFQPATLQLSVNRAVALGVALRNIDDEVELSLRNTACPQEKLQELKETKKTILVIKKQEEIEERIEEKKP